MVGSDSYWDHQLTIVGKRCSWKHRMSAWPSPPTSPRYGSEDGPSTNTSLSAVLALTICLTSISVTARRAQPVKETESQMPPIDCDPHRPLGLSEPEILARDELWEAVRGTFSDMGGMSQSDLPARIHDAIDVYLAHRERDRRTCETCNGTGYQWEKRPR